MPRITFFAEEGCYYSGIVGSVDALSIANSCWKTDGGHHPLFKTEIVSVNGKTVRGNSNIIVQPDKSIHYVEETDFIWIPPFSSSVKFDRETVTVISDWLRHQYKKNILHFAA